MTIPHSSDYGYCLLIAFIVSTSSMRSPNACMVDRGENMIIRPES